MLSNDFWYGFILGFGLVALIAIVSVMITRARSKDTAPPK
jgi:tetrahydromethanopterin S-methyltransferase subunit B